MEECMKNYEERFRRVGTLKEKRTVLARRPILYRLCVCRFAGAQYYAEVFYNGERGAAYLGESRPLAGKCFEGLIAHGVTPCNLPFVLSHLGE